MSVYALDTNIVSYYLKNNSNLINRINDEIQNNSIIISPIVYFEIQNWLIKNDAKKKIAIFEKMYSDKGIGIIDKSTMDIASIIFVKLQKRGIVIDDADILIAAWCIQNDCILVTNNVKHFQNIEGLKIENWV